MSSYRVIAETSLRLRSLLWDSFASDPDIRPLVVPTENAIVFSNPTETARNSANRLSLWLYRVEENEFIKNRLPPRGGNGQPDPLKPPLGLDLSYLVTPFSGNAETDLHLLGRTMQALYDNAIVNLQDDIEDVHEELRIILDRISLEEITRIWEALNEPYRLSVCYCVRVNQVESRQISRLTRIEDSARGYGTTEEGTRL